MDVTTAMVLGAQGGTLVGLLAVAAGWEVGDREARREASAVARRALRDSAGDRFYAEFQAYLLGLRRAADALALPRD